MTVAEVLSTLAFPTKENRFKFKNTKSPTKRIPCGTSPSFGRFAEVATHMCKVVASTVLVARKVVERVAKLGFVAVK